MMCACADAACLHVCPQVGKLVKGGVTLVTEYVSVCLTRYVVWSTAE